MADDERDVIYVEREDAGSDRTSPLWWLLLGGLVGAGVALLLAPRTGAETRRELGTQARRLQDLGRRKLAEFTEDDEDEEELEAGASGAWEDDADAEDWEGEYEAYTGDEDEEEEDLEDAAEEGGRAPSPQVTAARRELERRLARARKRREAQVPDVEAEDDEEPVA